MTTETRDHSPKQPRRPRRPYAPPTIMNSKEAFEHAILACTGRTTGFCTLSVPPKGGCTTICTASS